ncbi:MAG: hypothetical protein AAF962_01440 [Actinomycetota bacterium]
MTPSPNPDNRPAGRKSLRYLAGASLVSGGLVVGALFSPVGIAGAQTDDGTPEATEEADTTESTERDGERDHKGRKGKGARLSNFLETTGLTAEQVREGIEADQSLAQIAEANGVDVDALAADLEAAMTERINAKVEEGRITQEEADAKIAELGDKIDEKLNLTPSERQELRQERRAERQAQRDAEAAETDEEETLDS